MRKPGAVSFRPFEPSVAAYADVAALHNEVWPREQRLPALFVDHDDGLAPGHFFQRHIVGVAGQILGYGEINSHPSKIAAGQYDMTFLVRPALDDHARNGLTARLYSHLRARLNPQHPVLLLSWARSDRPQRATFLEREGFNVIYREPQVRLDLSLFVPSSFSSHLSAVAAQGVRLVPLSRLQTEDPDWEQKLYDLDWSIRQDMPTPLPRARATLKTWRDRLQQPGFRAAGLVVALDERHGGRYVGFTAIAKIPDRPLRGSTTTTGVRRACRRHGIARALKVAALTWAQEQGLTEVVTGNEADNPMLALNRQLGFRVGYTRLLYAIWPDGKPT